MLEEILDNWRNPVEILIISLVLYFGYKSLSKTRGGRVFSFLVIILLVFTLIVNQLEFKVISELLNAFMFILMITLIIIFQPELRHLVNDIGGNRFLSFTNDKTNITDKVHDAIVNMSNNRIGALIAIENQINLDEISKTGVEMDSVLNPEIITSIFFPKSTLHDGGLIIKNERIHAAGCIFPLSQRELNDRSIGLRHRAALGITEETDAIVITVSEETGNISLCHQGNIQRNLSKNNYKEKLNEIFDNDKEFVSDGNQ